MFDQNSRVGIALMIIAMMVIPVSDGIIKLLSDDLDIMFLNWSRFFIGAVIFIPFAIKRHRRHRIQTRELLSLSIRTILHIAAVSFYFLAIARIPLADAIGAYFLAPIAALLFAVVLLGEKLSPVLVGAVVIGFVGTALIVQPGTSMDVGMVYAVLAGIIFGLFLALTRKAGLTIKPIVTLGFQCGVGTILLLPFGLVFASPVVWADGVLLILCGAIWAIGHYTIILAFTFATTSVLAPIVYVEIVGAAMVGYWLFGDVPDTFASIGIMIVIVTGLFAQYMEGRKNKTSSRPSK